MSCMDSRIPEDPFESKYYEYFCCIIRIMIPVHCLRDLVMRYFITLTPNEGVNKLI